MIGFLPKVEQVLNWKLRKNTIDINNSWLLPALEVVRDISYDFVSEATSFFTFGDKSLGIDYNVFLAIQITPASTERTTFLERISVAVLFAELGGILYTLRSVSNGINHGLETFIVDNDMMRKLYSQDPVDGPQSRENRTGFQLLQILKTRKAFYYNWKDFYLIRFKTIFCCCCCCCKRTRPTLQDKLFDNGRKKLYAEIDLLQIIKQQRISQFANSVAMNPQQTKLVRWLD